MIVKIKNYFYKRRERKLNESNVICDIKAESKRLERKYNTCERCRNVYQPPSSFASHLASGYRELVSGFYGSSVNDFMPNDDDNDNYVLNNINNKYCSNCLPIAKKAEEAKQKILKKGK